MAACSVNIQVFIEEQLGQRDYQFTRISKPYGALGRRNTGTKRFMCYGQLGLERGMLCLYKHKYHENLGGGSAGAVV